MDFQATRKAQFILQGQKEAYRCVESKRYEDNSGSIERHIYGEQLDQLMITECPSGGLSIEHDDAVNIIYGR